MEFVFPTLSEEEERICKCLTSFYKNTQDMFVGVDDGPDRDINIPDSYYRAIPIGTYVVAKLMIARKKFGCRHFLDVGAGMGNVMKLATAIEFESVTGIEVRREYEKHLKYKGARVFMGDAFSYPDYADHDLIYLFRPIADSNIMNRLITHIVEKARIGTVFILEGCDTKLKCMHSYLGKQKLPYDQEFMRKQGFHRKISLEPLSAYIKEDADKQFICV